MSDTTSLALLHPSHRDEYVYFEQAGHKYWINWQQDGDKYVCNDKSVTKIVSDHFPKFDPDAVIKKMRSRRMRGKKRRSKKRYRGKTPEEIKADWAKAGKESCDLGTALHKQIEFYYNSQGVCEFSTSQEFEYFMEYDKFTKSRGLVPYRAEWIVYSDIHTRIVGTIDMVYVSQADKATNTLHLVIVDWKRIKAMRMWGQQHGHGPCSDLMDANYFKYSLQLNIYKSILETFYNGGVVSFDGHTYTTVVVDSMWLVVCHPKFKRWRRWRAPDLNKIVSDVIDERMREISKNPNFERPKSKDQSFDVKACKMQTQ